jgi:type II secretory pathway component PulM
MNALASWWGARASGERRGISVGAAVVGLLLFVAFVWLPLERARTRVATDLPALGASVKEMRAQAEQVKSLRTMPSRASATNVPLATLVANGTLALGLPDARVSTLDAQRLKLTAADVAWTRLLEWISAAQAVHGLAVDAATIEALPSPGRVHAELVLVAP